MIYNISTLTPLLTLFLIAISSGKEKGPTKIEGVPEVTFEGAPSADGKSDPSKLKEPVMKVNASDVADNVLKHVRKEIKKKGLSTVRTPNQNFTAGPTISVYLENGTMSGMSHVYRVGDAIMISAITDSKIRTAFGFTNVTSDSDAQVQNGTVRYNHGHINLDVDNVTVFMIFKFDHMTRDFTLDEFKVSVGKISPTVTGMGEESEEKNKMVKKIVQKTKGPLLKMFNVTFKMMITAALSATKGATHGIAG